MKLSIQRFVIERDGNSVALAAPSGSISLINDELDVPALRITARAKAGLSATFVTGGKVHRATTSPDVDIVARVEPIDLSKLSADLAGVERAAGTIDANLRVLGSPSALRYSGGAHLHKGDLNLRGVPLAIQDVEIDLDIAGATRGSSAPRPASAAARSTWRRACRCAGPTPARSRRRSPRAA